MGDDFVLSIGELLETEAAPLGEAIKQALLDQGQKTWTRLSSSWLGSKAGDAINDALADFNLFDAITAVWAGAREIAERGDTVKHPQNRATRLKLGKHDVDVDLHPQLSLVIAGLKGTPLDVPLTLTATASIEAVELRIKQGFIIAMGCGTCEIAVTLKSGERTLTPRRSVKKFDLPGDHRFPAPGIDIRPQHLRTANSSR